MDIAALIPTLHRPEGLRRALRSLRETAPNVVPVVAMDLDDTFAASIAREYDAKMTICTRRRAGCASAWNTALKAARFFDAYVIASDDCEFVAGWLEAFENGLEQIGGSGLVGFATHKQTSDCDHYVMTRDFIIDHHGGVAAIPHYTSQCVDAEACERARQAKKFIKLDFAGIVHHWRKSTDDECYQLTSKRAEQNKQLFYERQRLGFPNDFEPILRRQ